MQNKVNERVQTWIYHLGKVINERIKETDFAF